MGALSKGCGTCKKRKVKCDERHPKCTRCSAAGIECTGFAPQLRFVDEKPRIRRNIAVLQAQTHEISARTSNAHLSFHSSRIPSARLLVPVPSSANTLPLTAFKDDIVISFLVTKFFEARSPSSSYIREQSPCGLPTEWTHELVTTPQKPRPKSWDALASIVFGQANRNYDLIKSARGLYWQALSELRVQLSDPHNRYSHSTLASITALYMYQIIVSKTEKSWMLHIDGLGGILQSRGPWLLKSYAGKRIFLEHRIALVAKAIMSGQRTFLRQTVWKTVPWEDDMASKLAMDYLVDIMADITDYLADINTLQSADMNQELDWTQLRNEVAITLKKLNIWWCQWEVEHPNAVTGVPSAQGTKDRIFPTLLEYDMLATAYEVCFYNTVRILLLQLCHKIQLFPYSNPKTGPAVILDMPNSTILLGITSDVPGLASEILRSLKYCYGKSRRFLFTFSFLFIQEVAYGCFEKGSAEALWSISQDWAGPVKLDDVQDANLLKRLLPEGKIKLV